MVLVVWISGNATDDGIHLLHWPVHIGVSANGGTQCVDGKGKTQSQTDDLEMSPILGNPHVCMHK